METLASRLKWAREQRGLTQAALAKAACMLTGRIADLEDGRRDQPRDLTSLAVALGVRPAWLESGQGDWREAAPGSREAGSSPVPAAGLAAAGTAGTLGETIVQLGVLLSPLSPLARASIAPLIAKVAEDPGLAAEAARIADAIARS